MVSIMLDDAVKLDGSSKCFSRVVSALGSCCIYHFNIAASSGT